MGNESPFHERNLPDWFLRVLAQDGNSLSWSDVVTRVPVVIPRGSVEVLLNNLLTPGKPVPSAHAENYDRWLASMSSVTTLPLVFGGEIHGGRSFVKRASGAVSLLFAVGFACLSLFGTNRGFESIAGLRVQSNDARRSSAHCETS